MNKMRRNKITATVSSLETIKEEIEDILSEEQEYYDNIPENLQFSERADQSSDAIDTLEEAISDIETIIENLEEVLL